MFLTAGPGADARLALDEADEAGKPLEGRERFERLSISEESQRLSAGYPRDEDDIMPTRLGNVLRRHERLAGSEYGLDAITVVRHVALVAPPERLGYLNDQRQLLDLSVRMSVTSILAALIAIAALWRHGPWLLVALVPYAVAYLSYRGAVVVADEYGAAFSTMIDLDRFALYDQLRMPRPKNIEDERRQNENLVRILNHNDPEIMRYEYPPVTAGADQDHKAT
jgi:hypothetical protein